jgi:hypothetical protein
MTVKAADRQTWYDLAIQYTGYAWNAVAIAAANGWSPETDLKVGQAVEIPDTLPVNRAVVEYYRANRIAPATAGQMTTTTTTPTPSPTPSPSPTPTPEPGPEPGNNYLVLSVSTVLLGATGNEQMLIASSNTTWEVS